MIECNISWTFLLKKKTRKLFLKGIRLIVYRWRFTQKGLTVPLVFLLRRFVHL